MHPKPHSISVDTGHRHHFLAIWHRICFSALRGNMLAACACGSHLTPEKPAGALVFQSRFDGVNSEIPHSISSVSRGLTRQFPCRNSIAWQRRFLRIRPLAFGPQRERAREREGWKRRENAKERARSAQMQITKQPTRADVCVGVCKFNLKYILCICIPNGTHTPRTTMSWIIAVMTLWEAGGFSAKKLYFPASSYSFVSIYFYTR